MDFVKRYSKFFVSMGLITAVLFSGQNISLAEDQQTNKDLIPTMTDFDKPGPIIISESAHYGSGGRNDYGWKAFDDSVDFSHLDFWYVYATTPPEGGHFLKIDFGPSEKKKVNTMTITPLFHNDSLQSLIKDWKFYGSNDGLTWSLVTEGTFENDRTPITVETNNDKYFRFYRINVLNSYYDPSGSSVGIMEIEMTGDTITSTDPEPKPEPEPTGDNALLVIKMISGLEKEFELTATEVQDFIDWYNGRADGRGKETYMFDKDFNKGPFTARKDYVAFSKIQSFEVVEYTK
ncbi:discoidin domain-containing protein [Brevibacillus sp. DP1.3A]|uniref:discoidin domain-containing protein n=1 Tax=Brevibacillus sp. DP1.3A TaxID=2738867 RepID=UPI001D169EE7|nr:discoidin domain-containing protein [Brevibacillus sp. DP1.3A]UED77508.1 discoidin domain-containing protein [Brevibacillus sp. DP1.3A]